MNILCSQQIEFQNKDLSSFNREKKRNSII